MVESVFEWNSQLILFVGLNNLLNAFQSDSDLAALSLENISKIISTLFLSTGSDYTSFFKNIRKATVLNIFYAL